MSLILRVDVDKPYGHGNLIQKIASKITEDYFRLPFVHSLYYLHAQTKLLDFCNAHGVQGIFYQRSCTLPNKKVLNLIETGGHKIGFHAENTRSKETFSAEIELFKSKLLNHSINSFTKHGSGQLKLGKHHYPKYEPDKYIAWAKDLNLKFPFGNEIGDSAESLIAKDNFHSSMFWMERDYRHSSFSSLEQLIELAKTEQIVVIVHPANFATFKDVQEDLKTLFTLAKANEIKWEVF